MRYLGYAAALLLLLGSGAAQGLWAGRWSGSHAVEEQVAAMRRVPLTIGDWSGMDLELDARVMEAAGIDSALMRRYTNPRGEVATVLLVCGRPGPISVHTPEICYPSAGYEVAGPLRRLVVSPGRSTDEGCWVVDFGKGDAPTREHLRVCYTWSADGSWKVADRPRLEFAGFPALYKLYVIRALPEAAAPDEVGLAFLRELLPELRRALFPS